METGLEKMRNKIMEDCIHWKHINWVEDFSGDGNAIYYNPTIDVTCYMLFEKDMDQEYYLTKIEFYDGKQYVEEVEG